MASASSCREAAHRGGLNSAVTLENIVVTIVVGLIAGFLASRVVLGKGRGWFWDIIIGILGAIIGGWLAGVLHISVNVGPSILNQIIIAFAGAVLLLLIWRLLFRRGK
ncbi:MAG: GlsB/YeaQ/YmgE family stress response membrane protein [Chloroflexi bacterium]|nr:MAG: GlsB/YeaQ/YmgE family stress response membrane protein [Chloroflexota bacterium]